MTLAAQKWQSRARRSCPAPRRSKSCSWSPPASYRGSAGSRSDRTLPRRSGCSLERFLDTHNDHGHQVLLHLDLLTEILHWIFRQQTPSVREFDCPGNDMGPFLITVSSSHSNLVLQHTGPEIILFNRFGDICYCCS